MQSAFQLVEMQHMLTHHCCWCTESSSLVGATLLGKCCLQGTWYAHLGEDGLDAPYLYSNCGRFSRSGAIVAAHKVEMPARRHACGSAAWMGVANLAAGVCTHADVTIWHPGVLKCRRRAARTDGQCEKQQSGCVIQAWQDGGLMEVTLFAVETFGRLGPAACRLLASTEAATCC